MGRRAEPPTLEEVTPYLEEQRRLEQLVGQIGITETHLNPGGIVRIQDHRIHCRSEGVIVPKGTAVLVIRVSRNGLLVREAPSAAPDRSEGLADGESRPEKGENPLDFEVPNS